VATWGGDVLSVMVNEKLLPAERNNAELSFFCGKEKQTYHQKLIQQMHVTRKHIT